MAEVPAKYIRQAPVDWLGEYLSAAGECLPFGSASVEPATFRVWAMLELIDCDFVHPKKSASMFGAILAGFIACHPAKAQGMLREHLAAGHGGRSINEAAQLPLDDSLTAAAVTFAASAGATPADYERLGSWLMMGFAGFNMLPGTEGGAEYIFGMDQFAGMVAACGAEMGTSWIDLMETVPLVVIGHVIAQKSKQNGAKGVSRPKDKGHMREMFEVAKKCEAEGRLFPWQEAEPLYYGLQGHENADEQYRLAVLMHEERVKQGIA